MALPPVLERALESTQSPEDLVIRAVDSNRVMGLHELRLAAALCVGKDFLATAAYEEGSDGRASLLDLAIRFGCREFAAELALLGIGLRLPISDTACVVAAPSEPLQALLAAASASASVAKVLQEANKPTRHTLRRKPSHRRSHRSILSRQATPLEMSIQGGYCDIAAQLATYGGIVEVLRLTDRQDHCPEKALRAALAASAVSASISAALPAVSVCFDGIQPPTSRLICAGLDAGVRVRFADGTVGLTLLDVAVALGDMEKALAFSRLQVRLRLFSIVDLFELLPQAAYSSDWRTFLSRLHPARAVLDAAIAVAEMNTHSAAYLRKMRFKAPFLHGSFSVLDLIVLSGYVDATISLKAIGVQVVHEFTFDDLAPFIQNASERSFADVFQAARSAGVHLAELVDGTSDVPWNLLDAAIVAGDMQVAQCLEGAGVLSASGYHLGTSLLKVRKMSEDGESGSDSEELQLHARLDLEAIQIAHTVGVNLRDLRVEPALACSYCNVDLRDFEAHFDPWESPNSNMSTSLLTAAISLGQIDVAMFLAREFCEVDPSCISNAHIGRWIFDDEVGSRVVFVPEHAPDRAAQAAYQCSRNAHKVAILQMAAWWQREAASEITGASRIRLSNVELVNYVAEFAMPLQRPRLRPGRAWID